MASKMAHRMRADEPSTGLSGHVTPSLGSRPHADVSVDVQRRSPVSFFVQEQSAESRAAPRLSFGQDKTVHSTTKRRSFMPFSELQLALLM
jgi:hypothetical protein